MSDNNNVTLTIKYVDGTSLEKDFNNKKEALWFTHMEGDHVLDYSIQNKEKACGC